jgi:glucose-6-phosphate 1-dehydrogenase
VELQSLEKREGLSMAGDAPVRQVTLVFFGGTGDLASRKLIPALFQNWRHRQLADCLILGVGRRYKSLAEYRQFLAEHVAVAKDNPAEWQQFLELIDYHQGDVNTREDFESLKKTIEAGEKQRGLPGKRLFYLAVAPEFFAPIAERLSAVGLLQKASGAEDGHWTRLVVEKPFGTDLRSSEELNHRLLAVAEESQIYRIDHYLGKETVQNLLVFRFGNGIFEPVWNQRYVESVQITVGETLGVEGRGAYYDTAGAFRDMVLNHMTQLVAMTAMEPPIRVSADAIRDEKVKVLEAIRIPQSPEEVRTSTVWAQYGPGTSEGKPVPGYREEKGVAPDSRTPTFVALRLYLDNWRWAHVPFYLRHGKRLAKRGTEIAIQFRTPPLALFRDFDVCGRAPNLLVVRVQPNEGIELHFGAKRPGLGLNAANVRMDFTYEKEFRTRVGDAYERLLLDALRGDATLFTRSDEVRYQWDWGDALLKAWEADKQSRVLTYPAGSWGPPESESLFPHGHEVPVGLCPVNWRRW